MDTMDRMSCGAPGAARKRHNFDAPGRVGTCLACGMTKREAGRVNQRRYRARHREVERTRDRERKRELRAKPAPDPLRAGPKAKAAAPHKRPTAAQVAEALAAYQRAGGRITQVPTKPSPPRSLVPVGSENVDLIGRLA